ncbi:uncharacterized protein CANTADRAFT_52233 [Suhomyces tanzawaensis NRRL Y-17324]|uniref:RRM domain-containing protein n=1 Tax=Suhomyces tanzawaensis NRRL Y-17324 TaxID=984487 RepID=A0A1E4SIX4_9ASCO|nr:uncharacterized protein CANTADRAFT_52233 [Suhomyces tanzawaensis NRRL Y-17324]ODV79382.1 hypothetical protein CANTADRAFT_52233 [Suhomyces tanzawaensis NRRL Y-17324]
MASEIARKESKKDKKDRKEKKKELKKKATKKEASDEEVEAPEQTEAAPSGTSNRATLEEISIDLAAGVPLSKKQQRLLKKGKLNLEKLAKKNPPVKPEPTPEEAAAAAAAPPKSTKSEFGVWIGNLSFDTTREDLIRFIVGKTSTFGESASADEDIKVTEDDISRVNLPKKENKIKGFAYVDLPSLKHVTTVIGLSESVLNGRKLLIKNANSFEGRPAKDAGATSSLSKNPPSRILFVGNLPFDTTEDNLEEHFRHCGDIVRIRMATFEDTGKCKGFAFIDFKDETGPTTALKSKLAKSLINRPLRLEYGEDRSKRTPKREDRPERQERVHRSEPAERFERPARAERPRPPKRSFRDDDNSNKRLKSSVALANAQRASAAIVPSTGKKTTFD